MSQNWYVYVIRCSDNTLYAGITTDMARRFQQHLTGTGAKYFRGRQPEKVVYLESGHNRSTAGKRELQIKALSRAEKDELVSGSVTDRLSLQSAL